MTWSGCGMLGRRDFLGLMASTALGAAAQVVRPAVSETACPLQRITPTTPDGHAGLAFVRRPPGSGPFPVAVLIHGGLVTWPEAQLREYALTSPLPCRWLSEGYVMAALTYRSRDRDPQDRVSVQDCLAAVTDLKRLPFVDPKSVVIFGCSGGGDLALEVAATTEVCAIVPEEPASLLLTGMFNSTTPKAGARYTPGDGADIVANPRRYYSEEFQKLTRAKLARIECPIFIVQGDVHPINQFNKEILIPELRAAGKQVEVRTYSGEPHCCCFYGEGPRTPHPEIALQAFTDVHAFCRRHLPTQPKALDPTLLRRVPVKPA